jgi:tetratricopeptide (TPR) repeat protein
MTGAGTVVSGAVYLVEGDSVEVQVDVTDAVNGRLVGNVLPVRGARSAATEVIEQVQERVMVSLAVRFEEQLGDWAPDLIGDPPSYEAFEAFSRGLELQIRGLREDREEYARQYRRAAELAPMWAAPLMRLQAISDGAERDSIVTALEGLGNRLTPYERATIAYQRAAVDGDPEQIMSSIRRAAELGPGSPSVINYVNNALRQVRPREALNTLMTLNPERGWWLDLPGYWSQLALAYHGLGEHEKELDVARRAYQRFGASGLHIARTLIEQARALAALGRIEELRDLWTEIETAPDAPSVVVNNGMLLWPVELLDFYGHPSAASEIKSRAVTWFEERIADETASPDFMLQYGRSLLLAGNIRLARVVLDSLVITQPEDVEVRGVRGVIASLQSDSVQALEDLRWLEQLDRPYLYGDDLFWRGAINGALGAREQAVNLIREALSRRYYFYVYDWARVELASLHDYEPFLELTRPKG